MAEPSDDPYWRLRAPPPTPADELCACADDQPIMLAPHLSENPLACVECGSEVPPERVGFPGSLAEQLAFWQSFHDCFYLLWLDSGEFESWAQDQLKDPASPVNARGRVLVRELNAFHRAYYWWFQAEGGESFQPLERCPVCNGQLSDEWGRRVCDPCSVAVAV